MEYLCYIQRVLGFFPNRYNILPRISQMRIWQKTHLNSPVSFYGIEIPFRHAEKPTGFLQPVLLLYSYLSSYHTLISSNATSHTCISPPSIILTCSTGSSIASASIFPWELGVIRRPCSHFPQSRLMIWLVS